MATTQSPTRVLSPAANCTVGSGSSLSTLSSARSVRLSVPTISASSRVPSSRITVTVSAPAITWLLVTMWPSASMMKPEPMPPLGVIGPGPKSGVNPKRSAKSSPKKRLNCSGMRGPLHSWEVSAGRALCMTSMETTAGLTASTTPARLGVART